MNSWCSCLCRARRITEIATFAVIDWPSGTAPLSRHTGSSNVRVGETAGVGSTLASIAQGNDPFDLRSTAPEHFRALIMVSGCSLYAHAIGKRSRVMVKTGRSNPKNQPADPAQREKQSASMKARWDDPVEGAKLRAAIANSENRAKISAASRIGGSNLARKDESPDKRSHRTAMSSIAYPGFRAAPWR